MNAFEEWMGAITTAHAEWLARVCRTVDPRDIGRLHRICRRNSQNEDVVLRGVVVGTWRCVRENGCAWRYVGTVCA